MKERKGFYIRLNENEVMMVAELKKAAINITQLLKNCIRDNHKKVSKHDNGQ